MSTPDLPPTFALAPAIHIRGARQHNLRDVSVDIPHGALTVVTGPSGAGKSSLVFDTLYAEGQRRYVETFSAYARQFLDRMPRAAVDAVEGVPAAVAIASANTVRNSRSTVGTMTELNDHLKLLFAHAAQLFDAHTGEPVRAHTPHSIWADVRARAAAAHDPRLALTFAVQIPAGSTSDEVQQWLAAGGFTKVLPRQQPSGDASVQTLDVVADRFRASRADDERALQAIELALARGTGHMRVYVLDVQDQGGGQGSDLGASPVQPTLLGAYSTQLHCAASGLSYRSAHAGMFSFNSASGACPTCRGFGRVIGIDWARVVPNAKLTLRTGAIAPLQTPAWAELQADLLRFAQADGIPIDIAWSRLNDGQRQWVLQGAPQFKGNWTRAWAGVERFFEYVQSKSYKMHMRVLLSRYRSYTSCPDCAGARLQPDSLLWRVGTKAMADAVLPPAQRFMPRGVRWDRATLEALPGLCLHDLMRLPIDRLDAFCAALFAQTTSDASAPDAAPNPASLLRPTSPKVDLGRGQPDAPNAAAEEQIVLHAQAIVDAPNNPSAAPSPASLLRPTSPKVDLGRGQPDLAHAAPADTPTQQALRLLAREMAARLAYLREVGLGYLHLDRPSRTLSGGEVQRIHLTGALGASLTRTLFVMDEPSTGLHPRDLARISRAMHRLRDAGNTLVVVEHDPALMNAADHLIDMGPAAGALGGQVVFEGTPAAIVHSGTLTGAYLGRTRRAAQRTPRTVDAATPRLELLGARGHNVGAGTDAGLDVAFPLQRLVVVTGVSGSGKSTLMGHILKKALAAHLGERFSADAASVTDASEGTGDNSDAPEAAAIAYRELRGTEHIGAACVIDQSPIGKSARSTPVSYVGAWDGVRTLFAAAPLSRERGCTAAHFSFNAGDGRCPTCGGSGFEHVEMQFLSDVYLPCPACNGSRWRAEMLDIRIEVADGAQLNVAQVLDLTVTQAIAAFAGTTKTHAAITGPLQALADVGLGYLKLGQSVPTLSGGEAQRLKIAAHIAQTLAKTAAAKNKGKSKSAKAAPSVAQPAASSPPPSAAAQASIVQAPITQASIAQAAPAERTLFLLDEPTTGLHFEDIAQLMRALQALLDAGHSLIVVEHNLDVIAAADWLIDLGPDAGAAGGQIVLEAPPAQVLADPSAWSASHTARALREYVNGPAAMANAMADNPIPSPPAHEITPTSPKTPEWHVRGLTQTPAQTQPSEAVSTQGVNAQNAPSPSAEIPTLQTTQAESIACASSAQVAAPSEHASLHNGDAQTALAHEITPTSPKTPEWHVRSLGQAEGALDAIEVIGARENNLRNLHVAIAHGRLSVVTGVSGSGKSTLAFDIVFGEGQRRYLETLGAWARSIVGAPPRPQVQAVRGIAPSVAIEQRLSRGGAKSTVGTMTEIWHYLRLLFVKLGVQHCPKDGAAVQPQTPAQIAAQLQQRHAGHTITLMAPLVIARKGIYTDLADAARAQGVAHLRVDGAWVSTAAFPKLGRYQEHTIEQPVATLTVSEHAACALRDGIDAALALGRGVLHVVRGGPGLTARGVQKSVYGEVGTSGPNVSQNATHDAASHAGNVAATPPDGDDGEVAVFSLLRACPQCATSYPEPDPRLFSFNSPQGWCPDCVGTGLQLNRSQRQMYDDSPFSASAAKDKEAGRAIGFEPPEAEDIDPHASCPTCQGTRLNPVARSMRFAGRTIAELARWSVRELHRWALEQSAAHAHDARAQAIARDLWGQILHRLDFLQEVGLDYLSLDRSAPTLSGGEAQRIRLAAQLGSQLHGACYVLDEPTIGLHPRDNLRLVRSLQKLSARGNTLIVVEHDRETICAADHIIDIGPGAGRLGGELVAQGSVADLIAQPRSVTGQCLAQPLSAPAAPSRPMHDADWAHALTISGARVHNLKGQTVRVPLRRLVAITGVSGSGKSTLAHEVLLRGVRAFLERSQSQPMSEKAPKNTAQNAPESTKTLLRPTSPKVDLGRGQPPLALELGFDISGCAGIDRVLVVDQTPIGKTPRSCPATYVGFFDAIRKLFAATLQAQALGWGAGHFSFNTTGGRCPTCEGQGVQTLSMSFLPDVKSTCPDCGGTRYTAHTRAVLWRGKSIADVLAMTVDEAVDFFQSTPTIARPIELLQAVGLGYLSLGQSSATLSGGEAQRIKLVSELARAATPTRGKSKAAAHTLYLLDEPTVGLHMRDVEQLSAVLHRLVDAGHSVVCIEHDVALIAQADWVIDMGPEGGAGGGQVVGAAPPQAIARLDTHTGRALAGVFGSL